LAEQIFAKFGGGTPGLEYEFSK